MLQFRDVTIVKDDDMTEKILEIEVRAKRGVGCCKSMPGAVRPFERLKSQPRPLRLDQPERGRGADFPLSPQRKRARRGQPILFFRGLTAKC